MSAPLFRSTLVALLLTLLLTACSGGSDHKAPVKKVDTDGDGKVDTPVTKVTELPPDPRFGMPQVGQCHAMTRAQSRTPVATTTAIPCRRRHTTVVAYVGLVRKAITSRTPIAKRQKVARRLCQPAFNRAAGGTPADRATTLLTWTFFTPAAAQVERGARWVRCDVLARSGKQLVPLPPAAPLLKAGIPEPLRVCQTGAGLDVSCGRPHQFRVDKVFRVAGAAYPDLTAFTLTARTRCEQLTGRPGGYWQPPSRPGWASGDRFVRCLSAAG